MLNYLLWVEKFSFKKVEVVYIICLGFFIYSIGINLPCLSGWVEWLLNKQENDHINVQLSENIHHIEFLQGSLVQGLISKVMVDRYLILNFITHSGERLTWRYWAPGQPSKTGGIISIEDCAQMRRKDGWRWHDYHCDSSLFFRYKFICEFRK